MRRNVALFAAVAVVLVGVVAVLAARSASPPARCAEGMIALGARCCGEGQAIEHGLCVGAPTRCAAGMEATPAGCVAPARTVRIAGGTMHVGPGDWEALGIVAPHDIEVGPFRLDAIEVTEARYAACVATEVCASVPLSGEPGRAVAGVTAEEAERLCAWAGGDLPRTEQLALAMGGLAGRRYPWGDTGAVCRRAAWGLATGPCGRDAAGPELAGSHPEGASPEGALDLAGNVAEWTLPPPDGAPTTDARGGSWSDDEASELRAWHREEVAVASRSPAIGFRCAYADRDAAPSTSSSGP